MCITSTGVGINIYICHLTSIGNPVEETIFSTILFPQWGTVWWYPNIEPCSWGPHNIKMSYRYIDSRYKDNTIWRLSYSENGNPFTSKDGLRIETGSSLPQCLSSDKSKQSLLPSHVISAGIHKPLSQTNQSGAQPKGERTSKIRWWGHLVKISS